MPQKDTIKLARAAGPSHSLAVLGIGAFEEAVYRALLRAPGSTVDELATQLGETSAVVAEATGELERKGFATHAPERVHRLFPSPPDIAIESLLLHRQMELQTARQAISELQQEGRSGGDSAPVVEIIDADPAAKIQPYLQSHRGAKHEVLCLVRPPFVVSSPDKIEEERGEARKRGVRYRNIVHPDVLAMPGWPAILKHGLDVGEEIRVSEFPFKMIVADRHLGLLPLDVEQPQGPILLLRRSAVLDALCELFEYLWARSAPINFNSAGSIDVGETPMLPPELESLIPLLAAGVNDKAVAEKLGISERTLMRRIDSLYRALDAKSRFQAGWLLALRTMKG